MEAGLRVDAAVLFEGANVLWDQEELSASIRMLQDIQKGADLRAQDIKIGKSELLAKLVNSLRSSFSAIKAYTFVLRGTVSLKRALRSLMRSLQTT